VVGAAPHYNYYRDAYDPSTARYGQPDPLGARGSANLYVYADDNPLRWIDPSGLFSQVGCDNCPEKETMEKQLKSDCANVDKTITDIALARCIKTKCRDLNVRCVKGCFQNFNGGMADPKTPREIVLCTGSGTPPNVNYGPIGIHEFAHRCGWQHGQRGKGVPNENGDPWNQ
jgi:hypothetical protein